MDTRTAAKKAWLKAKSGRDLTQQEKDVCIGAYYSNELPKDDEYNLFSWVEGGCKTL